MNMFTVYYVENDKMDFKQIEGKTNAYVFATAKIKTSVAIWIGDSFGNIEKIL